METFELADLRRIVEECVGGADTELDEAALDTDFNELGYDSLLVFEITVRIKDDFGVMLPDERVEAITTPRALLEEVREHLTGRSS
ncbi:acyl carrier protein [Thermobifida alba]|uniref:Acyl carrier protein n=1 Tax=Thermobifida alba TaxID=53522 RepID=A0ABY4KZH0_THEAE|nr:phosphopantetheine-binding protein [Thermobifida alba]UPT20827.1 acyl carrier protein [Thermobifida alba]